MKKSAARAEALLSALQGKERILIITHDNPDPDGIAAGMALKGIIQRKLGLRPVLAFGGIIGRAENKALVDVLGIDMVSTCEVDFARYDGMALVDTQPAAGNNSLPRENAPPVVAVIDHHPRQASNGAVSFVDIRPRYGACSTMLVEYLRALQQPIEPELATALFYGIKVDTQDLGRHASKADIDAYMYIFPLTDKLALPRIEYPRLPRQYFRTFHDALERTEVYDQVVISTIEDVETPNAVAEVSDLLLRLEGTQWSVCLGFFDDHLFISVRTADPEANAHEIIRRAIGGLGSGGGHGMLAGGRITVAGRNARERGLLRDEVAARFLRVLGVDGRRPATLLGSRERRAVFE